MCLCVTVGDKGGSTVDSFVTCDGPNSHKGTNVISATFLPAQQMMYLAYENGHDATHTVASCNAYVQLDMSQWFN